MIDNAPVKTIQHGGLTIEGYSRAAVQTYWRMPELSSASTSAPSRGRSWAPRRWFVSHGHLDHIAALPVYVARRRMMKMEPPVIYLPEETIEPMREIMRQFTRLDRGRMPCELRPAAPGDEIELSRELVVTVSADQAHGAVAGLHRVGPAAEAEARVSGPDRRPDSRPAAGRHGSDRTSCASRWWPTWATRRPRASTPARPCTRPRC